MKTIERLVTWVIGDTRVESEWYIGDTRMTPEILETREVHGVPDATFLTLFIAGGLAGSAILANLYISIQLLEVEERALAAVYAGVTGSLAGASLLVLRRMRRTLAELQSSKKNSQS